MFNSLMTSSHIQAPRSTDYLWRTLCLRLGRFPRAQSQHLICISTYSDPFRRSRLSSLCEHDPQEAQVARPNEHDQPAEQL